MGLSLGFGFELFGWRIWGLGFRVQAFGLRIQGLAFGIWAQRGFRVEGLGTSRGVWDENWVCRSFSKDLVWFYKDGTFLSGTASFGILNGVWICSPLLLIFWQSRVLIGFGSKAGATPSCPAYTFFPPTRSPHPRISKLM